MVTDNDANQQPGSVITPGQTNDEQPAQPKPATESPPDSPVSPSYTPTAEDEPQTRPSELKDALNWTAPEFISHDKSPGWYLIMFMAGAVLAGLIYLLSRDLITAIVVVLAAVTLAAYGARKPKDVTYSLDSQSMTIGSKHFSYEDFRSFSVIQEGAYASFNFLPMKRFAPPASIYCQEDIEDKVAGVLADRLPMEPHKSDLVEYLMRYIRF